MDMIKQYLKDPKIVGIAALLIGLLIGWLVIGWGIWPVTWVDADLSDLRDDLQLRTMAQVVDAYAMNGNAEDAYGSWQEFGADALPVYTSVKESGVLPSENTEYFEELLISKGVALPNITAGEAPVVVDTAAGEGDSAATTDEGGTEAATGEEEAVLPETAPQTEPEPEKQRATSIIGIVLGVLFALFLLGVAAFVYFFFFKKGGITKSTGGESPVEQMTSSQPSMRRERQAAPVVEVLPDEEEEYDELEEDDYVAVRASGASPQTGSAYLKQFITEYVFGNDMYDDTFSIDAASGEFLGECGVGIADTLGGSEPKNVSAFEIWLFDKNDVQTVTKVMMTDFAMNNPSILQRLEVKGEPVQIRPDLVVTLETATLLLEARILDVTYGRGGQAQNSYVQQMQVELTVTSREKLS